MYDWEGKKGPRPSEIRTVTVTAAVAKSKLAPFVEPGPMRWRFRLSRTPENFKTQVARSDAKVDDGVFRPGGYGGSVFFFEPKCVPISTYVLQFLQQINGREPMVTLRMYGSKSICMKP